jgi:small-conductance mechanosensitive channel
MQLPFDIGDELLTRLTLILVTLVVLVLAMRLAQRIARRAVQDPARVYRANRIIRRLVGVAAVVLVITLLSPDLRALVTVLTVIGAGLAIALREALLSVAGWIRIVMMSPYSVGERVQIGDVHGDVIDIRMLRTTLMEIRGWVEADQSTGRIVHVPNSWVFERAVYNYSRGFRFIWNEVSFTITFGSDWRAARDIIRGLAEESSSILESQAAREIREMSREFLVHYGILTPFVYVQVVENGVRLTLRYLCEVRKRRGTEHAFTVSILDAFREHGSIEFAYPQIEISTPGQSQFSPPVPPADGSPGLAAADPDA